MDFIKRFGTSGGQDLGHLGKKLTRMEDLTEEMAMIRKQMQILQLNVQNMRQILLTIARLSGIEPKVLVRSLQQTDLNEQFVVNLTNEEQVIQKENAKSKKYGNNTDDTGRSTKDKI